MRKPTGPLLLLMIFSCFANAGEPTVYRPLAFLAGHCWKGSFAGGKQSDEHCFTWIYGGKFLRDRHTLHVDGHPDALGESIYFWNSISKQIEYLYIESDGGFSRGPVSSEKDAILFPDANFVENGNTQVYRSRWQRSGDDAYDVVTEFQSKGAWVPGFSVHYGRLPDTMNPAQ